MTMSMCAEELQRVLAQMQSDELDNAGGLPTMQMDFRGLASAQGVQAEHSPLYVVETSPLHVEDADPASGVTLGATSRESPRSKQPKGHNVPGPVATELSVEVDAPSAALYDI